MEIRLEQPNTGCQISSLRLLANGDGKAPPRSLVKRLKLVMRRHLSPDRERAFKKWSNNLINNLYRLVSRHPKPIVQSISTFTRDLQAGDWVRVRSLEEIEATLNHWRQLRGCTFIPEMAAYCGTTQRVLKRVERFVDERDLRVKTSKGIVLLEGVMCKGTADFGSCDRSCLYFWREEWLEKINDKRSHEPDLEGTLSGKDR